MCDSLLPRLFSILQRSMRSKDSCPIHRHVATICRIINRSMMAIVSVLNTTMSHNDIVLLTPKQQKVFKHTKLSTRSTCAAKSSTHSKPLSMTSVTVMPAQCLSLHNYLNSTKNSFTSQCPQPYHTCDVCVQSHRHMLRAWHFLTKSTMRLMKVTGWGYSKIAGASIPGNLLSKPRVQSSVLLLSLEHHCAQSWPYNIIWKHIIDALFCLQNLYQTADCLRARHCQWLQCNEIIQKDRRAIACNPPLFISMNLLWQRWLTMSINLETDCCFVHLLPHCSNCTVIRIWPLISFIYHANKSLKTRHALHSCYTASTTIPYHESILHVA